MKDDGMRLDALLVSRGLVSGRDRAKELISQEKILINGSVAGKAALLCDGTETLTVVDDASHFVSRGGHKLEKALDTFAISAAGRVVLDVGASTGGFTQCVLEQGASFVYAVDVGKDQLASSLRQDSRVADLQQTDIRTLGAEQLRLPPQLAVCDVAFISLKLIFPAIYRLLAADGEAVVLIKPQFEAGKSNVGKHGLVKDPKVHLRVLQEVLSFAKLTGFTVHGVTYSPILGGDGNLEFLAWLRRDGSDANIDLPTLVKQAHTATNTQRSATR